MSIIMQNKNYKKTIRLLLSFVATGIFILAAYFVAAYFLDTFLTTYRWQIKALAIYNLIGGTQESWWTERATSIAWELLLNNQNIMGWVWTGAVSALTRIFLLGKGN